MPNRHAKLFRDVGADIGYGGGKLLGTLAVAIANGLDAGTRKTLIKYVKQKTWEEPNKLQGRRVVELMRMLLDEDQGSDPDIEPVWYVDKIVDPELSPEPGNKLSDKKGRDDASKNQSG